jgi:hypothetical protein
MKNNVKLLALITLFSSLSGLAQFKISAPNGFANDLKKIITSFPDHFSDYRGELIITDHQSTDYTCNLKVTTAEETKITTYSGKKQIWSWQAIMLSTESFDKAKQKFHFLFNQLNNLSINGDFRLSGKYEAPEEEKSFTSVIFEPIAAKEGWEKIRVELLMEFFSPMEWKIKVTVFDRDREDFEEGEKREK